MKKYNRNSYKRAQRRLKRIAARCPEMESMLHTDTKLVAAAMSTAGLWKAIEWHAMNGSMVRGDSGIGRERPVRIKAVKPEKATPVIKPTPGFAPAPVADNPFATTTWQQMIRRRD